MIKRFLFTFLTALFASLLIVTAWDSLGLKAFINTKVLHIKEAQTANVDADLTEDNLKDRLKNLLLENPEFIFVDTLNVFQQQEEEKRQNEIQQAILENKEILYNSTDPIMGNPEGDVTIIEFLDYNCGYCKRVAPSLFSLLEKDGELKIIIKEFPILSQSSILAAQAALAAHKQGKYDTFHRALIGFRGTLNNEAILAQAKASGLDMEQLAKDMDSEEIAQQLDDTIALAQALGVNGTPAFIIGDQLYPGALSKGQIEQLIEEVRLERLRLNPPPEIEG